MLRLGVLVSGGGSNLQAIIDGINNQNITNVSIATVVSSKHEVYALQRAKQNNIDATVIPKKDLTEDAFDAAIAGHMQEFNVDLIVMAGFLSIVGADLLSLFPGRIINVHPSLIPAFCGRGFYGLKVHEAALKRGVKLTGATVHGVNEIPDGGPILAQKAVEVKLDDTAESLQKRVMEEAEWVILPQVINGIANGKIIL